MYLFSVTIVDLRSGIYGGFVCTRANMISCDLMIALALDRSFRRSCPFSEAMYNFENGINSTLYDLIIGFAVSEQDEL